MRNLFIISSILFLLSSCEKKDERSELSQHLSSLSEEEQFHLISNERLAPNDTLISYDGSKILLSEIDGDVIVIGFWATWCSPCYKSIPKFRDLASKYDPAKVNFILISIDGDEDFWKTEVAREQWKDNSYWIGDDTFNNSIFPLVYEELDEGNSVLIVLPHYVICDKNGAIHLNTSQNSPFANSFKILIDSIEQSSVQK